MLRKHFIGESTEVTSSEGSSGRNMNKNIEASDLEKGTWSFENQLGILVTGRLIFMLLGRCSSGTFMNKTNCKKTLCKEF